MPFLRLAILRKIFLIRKNHSTFTHYSIAFVPNDKGKMRDIIVKILTRLGLYKSVVSMINRLKSHVQAKRMKKHGLEMLREADRVMCGMDIHPFLTYGILLGACREKNFISYDFDIDLGVLSSEVTDKMREKMETAGFKLYKQIYIKESNRIVEETYVYKKLYLDIFYYFEDGDDLYSVISRLHETKEWKEANETDGFPTDRSYVPKTEFERIDFLGVSVYKPVKSHEWLTDIYSDSYMTPIKNWRASDYKTRIVHGEDRTYRRYFS